jgi:hypothetical protein
MLRLNILSLLHSMRTWLFTVWSKAGWYGLFIRVVMLLLVSFDKMMILIFQGRSP